MTVELLKFLNNANCKDKKNILVVGVVHGDEPLGEYFILEHLKICNKNFKNNLYFIPKLNSSNQRKNANGVDLNRNFPAKNWVLGQNDDYFGGSAPNSEAETKFIINLTGSINFDAVITIHAPYAIINYDGEKNPNTLLLANAASKFLGYPIQKDIGYATPGSMGTYFGTEQNIPVITIETEENPNLELAAQKFNKFFDFLENNF